MPDFGFVGPTYVAASIYQNGEDCINWYAEIDPTKKAQGILGSPQRGITALYPCPGTLLQLSLPQAAPVRALYVVPGGQTLYAVCGTGLYQITPQFVATLVGTLSSNQGPVGIKDNGNSLYITDGANRYFYTWATNTFTKVTDGAFNGGTVVDIVDNYLIYNDPGTQTWGCTNIASIISNALNFGAADAGPDNLVSMIVVNREIFLITEYRTEVWIDVGTFPFPFQRIPGTSSQHGTVAPFSVARLGESCAYLSQDTRGQLVVVLMVGYAPKRISTHAIEQAIQQYTTVSDAIAFTYQQNGHEFYVLTFPTADATWVYDLATEMWHKRAWRDNNNVLHRHRANCMALFQGQIIVGDYQNGNLYQLSTSTYTDNGATLPCIRRSTHLTSDLKREFFHSLQIQFQPGVGLQTGQGSNPQAMLIWSDDGGSTWSNQHWTFIGKVGKYKNRAIWRRLGTARDRIFEVQVTDPVNRVVISAELEASAGAH